ncbi:MAG: hypothetical protein U0359_13770 [Byssovorax sp.]
MHRSSLRAALFLVLVGLSACHPHAPAGPSAAGPGAPQPAPARGEAPLPTIGGEAAPSPDLFSPKLVANLFSHPGPLLVSDVDMGPSWAEKGKVVWAVSFAADDGSFAPLTLILFEGRYRGLTITDNQRDLLRRSGLYKDLDFGKGRTGYALRAADDGGGAEETAAIRSPGGHYELLVLVSVPKGGPPETPGSAAYRSLLLEHTVRLMESVARGMSEQWKGP